MCKAGNECVYIARKNYLNYLQTSVINLRSIPIRHKMSRIVTKTKTVKPLALPKFKSKPKISFIM